MSDDVDDLLRRAMKTLDDQVPSGYFEGLPNRTLERLEGMMQQTPSGSGSGTDSEQVTSTGVPPRKGEEDSGLHDIRSLASSTKARLSSRRSTQNPIVPDEDILASTSAGWKAVALPEPAKMVSLPELAELPSKREIKEAQKAEKQAQKAERQAEQVAAPVATAAAIESAPAVTPIGARVARPKPSSSKRGPIIALVGLGLAAAAGAVIFVQTNKKSDDAPQLASAQVERKGEDYRGIQTPTVPTYKPQQEAAPAATPPVIASAGSGAAEPAAPPPEEPKPKPETGKKHAVTKAAPAKDMPAKVEKTTDKPDETKKPDPSAGKKEKSGEGEPSFDDLLKEAGVNQQKAEKKPTLAKKSLSGEDIKKGMGSVAAKAQACYAGQQGTAAVKLTVAPDGSVAKVAVTGQFAGTPVGTCVEAAVRGASFPPWDGGPQSFGYSYLLSE